MNERKRFFQGVLLAFACLVAGCSRPVEGTLVSGRVKDPAYEGRTVYLRDTRTSADIDSAEVKGGSFSFTLHDSVPRVCLLVLKASDDDLFPSTLPVVTEEGKVTALLGERVLTAGTPLNDKLQDFLLAVDRFSDEMAQPGNDVESVRAGFSRLLEASILQNADNAVGAYIFRSYLSRLTPEQQADILSKAGARFKEQAN